MNRGSFMAGQSTRNQRIERHWRDVHYFVVDKFATRFEDMEEAGLLDRDNAVHLFCLHRVYLPIIQKAIDTWVNTWNWHHGRQKGSHGNSPLKTWHQGKL
jgi:hypothetical protein